MEGIVREGHRVNKRTSNEMGQLGQLLFPSLSCDTTSYTLFVFRISHTSFICLITVTSVSVVQMDS